MPLFPRKNEATPIFCKRRACKSREGAVGSGLRYCIIDKKTLAGIIQQRGKRVQKGVKSAFDFSYSPSNLNPFPETFETPADSFPIIAAHPGPVQFLFPTLVADMQGQMKCCIPRFLPAGRHRHDIVSR
jgi:hypothetical protein